VDAADAQPPARPPPQYLRDRCSGSRPACGDLSSNRAERDPRPGEPQQKISGHLRSEQATRHRHTPSRAAASSNQGPREAPDRCTVPRGPPHLQNGPVCTRAAIRAEPARAEGHLHSVTIAGRGRRAVPADLRDRRLNAANQPGHADQVDLCADVVRICRICATPRDAVYAVATTSQMSAPERTRR
jgi:hypothetical protein